MSHQVAGTTTRYAANDASAPVSSAASVNRPRSARRPPPRRRAPDSPGCRRCSPGARSRRASTARPRSRPEATRPRATLANIAAASLAYISRPRPSADAQSPRRAARAAAAQARKRVRVADVRGDREQLSLAGLQESQVDEQAVVAPDVGEEPLVPVVPLDVQLEPDARPAGSRAAVNAAARRPSRRRVAASRPVRAISRASFSLSWISGVSIPMSRTLSWRLSARRTTTVSPSMTRRTVPSRKRPGWGGGEQGLPVHGRRPAPAGPCRGRGRPRALWSTRAVEGPSR